LYHSFIEVGMVSLSAFSCFKMIEILPRTLRAFCMLCLTAIPVADSCRSKYLKVSTFSISVPDICIVVVSANLLEYCWIRCWFQSVPLRQVAELK
jgi:hypothetical protein